VAISQRFDDFSFPTRPQSDDQGRFGERRFSESGSNRMGESNEYRMNRVTGDLVTGREQIFADLIALKAR
jgi:hypothetical protein